MEEGEFKVSPRYEFDAPHYYDFQREEPQSPEPADEWFNTRIASPPSNTKTKHVDESLELKEHQNQSNGDVSALDLDPAKASHTEPPQVKSTHPLKKIAKGLGNIVTSWGAPATRVIADPPDNTEGDSAGEAGIKEVQQHTLPKRKGFITPRRPKPTKTQIQEERALQEKGPAVSLNWNCLDDAQQILKEDQDSGQLAMQNPEGADDASSQLGARHTNSSVQSSRPPSKPRDNNPGKVSNENSSSNQPSKRLQNLQSAQMSQTRPTKRSKTATLLGAPALATSARARPPRYKSREQIEEEEMAAIPQFKARPFSGTKTTIPTVPIWDRPVSRRSISAQNLDLPANVDFKARPLNSKVLDAPKIAPSLAVREATIPQSPKLATNRRSRSQGSGRRDSGARTSQEPQRESKWQAGTLTTVVPFNLETENRGKLSESKREYNAKRKLEETENAPEFRAQPVPLSHYQNPVFQISNPVLTMPEPFNLPGEKWHQEGVVLKEMLNQQAIEIERKQRQFKARAVPKDVPVLPVKSDSLLTIPEPFSLPGDQRSVDRAKFDTEMREKALLQQAQEQADLERRKQEEAEELAKLRQSLEFKAKPMPKYPPTSQTGFQPPPLKWTEPVSPKLQTSKRARTKH